uniref:NADH-ubiquinone oxidoreductase chain 2 n=1 Tax=Anobiinae sp. BMNH 1274383 TaxID=1796498 RepID=A0A140EFV3_9COLE|nr:NADH dehydrogenase subunit 2 [Anobiinae sp. BMNH 1274383]
MNKLLFLMTLIISTLMTISSNSWFGMWMGLEINLLSIIPLMNNSSLLNQSEASLKYFLIQALASTILMFSLILMNKFQFFMINKYNYSLMIMFNSALLMKMGAAPFHFWLPEIMEGLNWFNCFIILTWQKIAPMQLIFINNSTFLIIVIILSMMISGIMGLNQISMRKILAYSSINHIGWMLTSLMFMKSIWMFYFITYFILSLNLILILNKFNVFNILQLFNLFNKNNIMKFNFMINFFSLAGLPPFLGFLPKWLTIQMTINSNMMIFSFLLMILTLLTMYYYIRLMFNALMFNSFKIKFKTTNFNSYFIIFMNMISLMSLLIITLIMNLN